MLLVPMNFFPWRVDYALEENDLNGNRIFAAYFIIRGLDTILIFCGYCFGGREATTTNTSAARRLVSGRPFLVFVDLQYLFD